MKKNKYLIGVSPKKLCLWALLPSLLIAACKTEKQQEKQQEKQPEQKSVDRRIKQMEPEQVAQLTKSIEAVVNPKLSKGLSLRLWAVDSLVADPIAIDVDDQGKLYYSRTNRQKHSEFDIRGHQDWETESISLQTIDDKRAFLRKVLSPENSKENEWLADLNNDGSHDWRDMTVEKEHVYRIEDVSGDGLADMSQLMVEDFNEEVTDVAGAVMAHEGDLFVGAGPDMWRLKDKNGDGVADDKTSISHGYGIHIGFGGHGMSGLEMGPDGKVYWGIGDIGFNGKGADGTKWEHPNSGVIARSNPDGSDFEIFAHGLRNTHEFTFDEYGNLISQDNDGDHPGEKERLVYVVNGSDTGWRINWQFGKYRDPDNNTYKVWMDENMYKPRFKGQAAYITPTIANFVSGPTGFVYNPGTALSPKYKNTFFVVEFNGNPARSGLHAFKLKPKGASFELGQHEQIMSNVLATGIDFGPDGAMYIADWIDSWDTKNYGRIWKMDVTEGADTAARAQTKALLGEDFSKRAENQLGELLSNPDMRVRQKAQFELAKRGNKGVEQFQKNINQTAHQLARVHGIWGLAQIARKDAKQAQLLTPLLKDQDPEIRAQAAKWIGDIRYKEAGNDLMPLLKDENSRARFFAAEALGRIAYEPAINPIIDMLKANNDEDAYLRHAGSLALARIGKAEPVVALHNNSSRALRIAAVVALRRLQHPGIANFLNDKDEFIVTETARAINDDLSIKDALPALGDLLTSTQFKNEALIRRAINANLRVGTEKAMQNLVAYTTKENAPATMRAEAIEALSTWSKPSVLDRVDGRYRGVIERDPLLVKNTAGEPLVKLLSDKNQPIRLSAIKAIGKHKIEAGSDRLYSLLRTDRQPEVRIVALRALANLDNAPADKAIQLALADKEKSVRVAGLDLLSKMDISKELMVSLLSDVINTRTTEEKQAALLTLGKLPVENSQKVFDGLLTKLANGKLPAEVHLELAEAIDSTRSTELKNRYNETSAKLSPDAVAATYEASLYGGSADEGRRIFFNNSTAQCLRCHSYDDLGGNAGPRLNGVASRISRKQILEALINPSARLAPGFGVVTLNLTGDKTISGILQEENAKGLVLRIGDRPDTLIPKAQIVKRTNAPSSMPNMSQLLTPREVRNLVSFLATLKEEI